MPWKAELGFFKGSQVREFAWGFQKRLWTSEFMLDEVKDIGTIGNRMTVCCPSEGHEFRRAEVEIWGLSWMWYLNSFRQEDANLIQL